jgi:hypothetical protein
MIIDYIMEKKIKVLNIRCMYDHIITTMNVKKGSVIVKTEDEILTRQTVLVAGPNAGIIVGEDVEIYVDRFPRTKRSLDKYTKNGIGEDKYDTIIPVEIIDGEKYLFISSREVKYVYIDIVEGSLSDLLFHDTTTTS